MKLRRIESSQFAGAKYSGDKFQFDDGINIILGENESGKSTMVDLVYNLLFRNVKLGKRKTEDKEFNRNYFPVKNSGSVGDVIDGKLAFETEQGTYTLEKEWFQGEKGTIRMRMPDGTRIADERKIESVLAEILKYSEGVYKNIVLASQRMPERVISKLMSEDNKELLKKDLSGIVTEAALETGGISIEKVERLLDKKLKLYNERWDADSELPENAAKRDIHNKWACATYNDRAYILRAYYDLKEAEFEQENLLALEEEIDKANSRLKNKKTEKSEKETELREFRKAKSSIENKSKMDSLIKSYKDNDKTEELKNWNDDEIKLKIGKELQKEKKNMEILEVFENLKKNNYIEKKNKTLEESVSEEELQCVHDADQDVSRYESKLAGLNIAAAIKKLGNADIVVKSLVSGKTLNTDDNEFDITESVNIIVPDVMELTIAPKGVNVEDLTMKLKDAKVKREQILTKYQVDSSENLEIKSREYKKNSKEVENLEKESQQTLDKMNLTLQEAKEINDHLVEVKTRKDIEEKEKELTEGRELNLFCEILNDNIDRYEKKYTSKDNLKHVISKNKENIIKATNERDSIKDIPQKYRDVTDSDLYEKNLEADMKKVDDEIQDILREKRENEIECGERTSEDLEDIISECKEKFEQRKTEYQHLENINAVFKKLMKENENNPMKNLEKNFSHYLESIAGDHLEIDHIDEKFNTDLSSSSNKLSYSTLSDGTKDTIELAFRLSMLEELYPDGDGLVVFDDPFTEMDPKRCEKACKLIKEFSENHQILFLTCDPKYKEMLTGNLIELS